MQFKKPLESTKRNIGVKHPLPLATYMPYRFFAIANKMTFKGKMTVDGVTISNRDWRILLLIAAEGPSTNQRLSELMFMGAGTVSRAIAYLRDQGLISVRKPKRDKRTVLIGLTQKGADIYDHLAALATEYTNELEAGLEAEEVAAFYSICDKIEKFVDANAADESEWDDLDPIE